jgi:hypothetical protein
MPNRNDSSSPLSRLINDDNLTILENVIPYCNTNLGKLLALCLKFSEMQKIIEGFDDSERLNACGFENNSTDIESILRSVRSSVSEEKARQIDNILQILNFSRFYEKYNQILSEHPELVRPPAPAAAETQNAPEANPFSDPSLFFLLNSLMNNSDGNQNEKLKQVMALAQNSDNKDMEKILSALLNSGL